MKIILSPAKKMKTDLETLEPLALPVFLEQTEELLHWLREKSYEELKILWNCNEKIAKLNQERLAAMDLRNQLTPAILSYEGIAYQYMAPAVFEQEQLSYVQEHLRILSAFYGVLKPMDGVTPYRLEMQAKASVGDSRDLYGFWKDRIYQEIVEEDRVIVNLASKEYSKCVERYLSENDRMIGCVFGELIQGKVVQKGTYAKMTRGEMVRFMAERQIGRPEEIKEFDRLGYGFCEELSSEKEYVFLK